MTGNQTNNMQPPCPYWGGRATLLFGALIAAAFVIVQLIVIGVFTAVAAESNQITDIQKFTEEIATNGFVLSIGRFSTTLVCVLLIFLFIRIKNNLTIKEYLALHRIPIHQLAPWAIVIAAFALFYDLFSHFIGRPIVPEFMITAYQTARFQPLLWIVLIVLAPLSEEFFFRGFLFQGFQSTFLKPSGTIVLTSFLWAAIHTQYDFYDMAAVFFLGILLGIARIKSGSILTALYLHGFINLIATIETAIAVS